MTTRARERRRWWPSREPRSAAAAALLCVLAGGCDPAPAQPSAEAPPAILDNAGDTTCLPQVWPLQDAPDEAFDVAHDAVEGGAISCATGTTPKAYETAVQSLRTAATSGDRGLLGEHLASSLLLIDPAGNRRQLTAAEAQATADGVFAPDVLALLTQLALEDMAVAPEGGGFFALGALWLAPAEPGGEPRIVTINRQALAEAAAQR